MIGQRFRHSFFLALILFSFKPIKAQWSVGVEGGYTNNFLFTNNSNRQFTNYKPQGGAGASMIAQYRFSNWLAVESGVQYMMKNYKLERTDFFQGIYQHSSNGYIQVPLKADFMFGGKRLIGFLNLGVYGAYWAYGHVKGSMPNILNPIDSLATTGNFYNVTKPFNYDEAYSFDKKRDNRFEFGWVIGLGISYRLFSRWNIF